MKLPNVECNENSPESESRCSVQIDRQTDITSVIVEFRNCFSKVPDSCAY
jgi:hypothetical protein